MATTDIRARMDGLTAHLRDNGLRADVEPAKVNVPGIWVALTQAVVDNLAGDGTLTLGLHLIVPDGPAGPVLDALDELLGTVLGLVDASGPVLPQSVVLPGNTSKPLPGLLVPVQLDFERTE